MTTSSWSISDILAVLMGVAGPLLFLCETSDLLHLQYSRFADRSSAWWLPSRWGMILFYAPAGLVPFLLLGRAPAPVQAILALIVSLHFLKRCLECLFVHRFTSVTSLPTIAFVSFSYMVASFLVVEPAAGAQAGRYAVPGAVLFIVGELGNLYHHWLLRSLRDDGVRTYKQPSGGVFAWVCCPHYLFEIIAWIGVAMIAGHIHAWTWVLSSALYLAGRSTATLKWYKQKNISMPKSWCRLIPYLF